MENLKGAELEMKAVSLLFGIACMLAGAFFILIVLAFASMIDPEINGREWWDEYISGILNQGLDGLGIGLILMVGGIGLVWSSRRKEKGKAISPELPDA